MLNVFPLPALFTGASKVRISYSAATPQLVGMQCLAEGHFGSLPQVFTDKRFELGLKALFS